MLPRLVDMLPPLYKTYWWMPRTRGQQATPPPLELVFFQPTKYEALVHQVKELDCKNNG